MIVVKRIGVVECVAIALIQTQKKKVLNEFVITAVLSANIQKEKVPELIAHYGRKVGNQNIMLEIIYRIYKVADEEPAKTNLEKDYEFGYYVHTSKYNNIELVMDCKICDSREQFKELIREEYGDISFRNSKKLKAGDLYCIIIGEHCYNTERYFNKVTFICDCCGATIETYYGKAICFSDYEVRSKFFGIEKYSEKRFCCEKCKQVYAERERKKLKPDDEQEFFVSKDMFTENIAGYIYLITKKSTGEFYVGQTIYAPIFRWGQHLKTERFPIENITDYKFEVLEIVDKDENILDREKYYIQKYYVKDPEKSLNYMCTKNIVEDDRQLSISL